MDVTPAAFKAIHTLDVDAIGQLSADELRPLLPCLVRMGVYSSCHNSPEWANKRKTILQIISQNEEVNSIISLLSVDFHAMEIDVKKELEQKSVLSANLSENLNRNPLNDNNVIISSIVNNLSLDFERSDGFCRMRLIISELFAIQAYASELRSKQSTDCLCTSELFDHDVYINELSDVLCIALAELPQTLQLLQIVETLLYVRSGPRLIQRIAANFSDQFESICRSLLEHGDPNEHEESLLGSVRTNVLRALCRMNPPFALKLRAAAIQMCRLPALCIHLTLDHMQLFAGREPSQDARYVHDLVDFVRGILLGPEQRASCLSALAAIAGNVASINGASTNGALVSSDLNGTLNGSCWPLDGQMQTAWNDALSIDHETGRAPELHEPVYTLVYQVYERLDRLLGSLDEHQRDGNKELLLLFAHVFTLFNATISEKIKLQHEVEEQRDRSSQINFRLNKEKEYGNRLRDKLEEYEAQTHDEIQKYEKTIGELEQRIARLDKDRRRMHFEQEDMQKELKHLLDGLGRLFELLLDYGSSDCGAGLFFQLARQLLEQTDSSSDARDRLKLLCQLNATLEKRLVDVKHDELRLQEQKILNKIRQNEQKINQIFENGCQSLDLPNDLNSRSSEQSDLINGNSDGKDTADNGNVELNIQSEGPCNCCGSQCLQCEHSGQSNGNFNSVPFALEETVDGTVGDHPTVSQTAEQLAEARKRAGDEMAERLRQLKELNQTNLTRLLQMEMTVKKGVTDDLLKLNTKAMKEQQSSLSKIKTTSSNYLRRTRQKSSEESDSSKIVESDNSKTDEEENALEAFVDQILELLLFDYVDEQLRLIYEQHKQNTSYKLSDMLTTGLVQVNHNNEIIAVSSPDAKLSQAQLMLINDKLNQSIQDAVETDNFQEDIHHRFEQSFTEIIRASVSSAEATPVQGETLKSILEKSDGDESMEWIVNKQANGDCVSISPTPNAVFDDEHDCNTQAELCNRSLLDSESTEILKTVTKTRVAQSRQELDEIDGQINDILCDINNLGVLSDRLYDQKTVPPRPGYRDCGVSTIGLISKHDSGTCTERTKKRDNFTWPMKIGQRHTSTNTAKRLHRNAFTFTEPELPVFVEKSEFSAQTDLPTVCASCSQRNKFTSNGKQSIELNKHDNSNNNHCLDLDQTTKVNGKANGKANGRKAQKSASVQTDFHQSSAVLGNQIQSTTATSGASVGRIPITEVCWRIPSISFVLTIVCYVFCFLKHLAFGLVFLFCSLIFLTQLLFSTTRIPPFHSWEEIIVKMLDPYLTKEHVY